MLAGEEPRLSLFGLLRKWAVADGGKLNLFRLAAIALFFLLSWLAALDDAAVQGGGREACTGVPEPQFCRRKWLGLDLSSGVTSKGVPDARNLPTRSPTGVVLLLVSLLPPLLDAWFTVGKDVVGDEYVSPFSVK